MTLTTDLIMGIAPPERAGAASGLSETATEFGGAILSMIDLAALNKIKVVLCAILPTTSYSWQPSVKDGTVRVIALNQ